MWSKIRSYRPSHATVVAYLALFVALGGSSYAAIKVTSKNVVNNSLTGADVKNERLDTRDVKNLRASDFRPGELPAGSQGPPGPKGDAGSQGERGEQGEQGAQGAAPACQGNGSGDAMVAAGSACIDKYEVSVWSSPSGGTQYGVSSDNYPCADNGQDCKAGTAGEVYARSVPGVQPSRFITYFQAQQALANVGKRLPSNGEWQQAAAGTPDPGADNGSTDCNSTAQAGQDPVNTGSRSSCVSNHGAHDMAGNVSEWVADWVPASTGCPGWGAFSDDDMCLSGASTTATAPGALVRGGFFNHGTDAGPFAVFGGVPAPTSDLSIGFRGAR
jgi:formylglycine-generating enzyme required for sulfatase activity